jgi:hypothetical protein
VYRGAQIAAYGQCVAANAGGLSKGVCEAQFAVMKVCAAKSTVRLPPLTLHSPTRSAPHSHSLPMRRLLSEGAHRATRHFARAAQLSHAKNALYFLPPSFSSLCCAPRHQKDNTQSHVGRRALGVRSVLCRAVRALPAGEGAAGAPLCAVCHGGRAANDACFHGGASRTRRRGVDRSAAFHRVGAGGGTCGGGGACAGGGGRAAEGGVPSRRVFVCCAGAVVERDAGCTRCRGEGRRRVGARARAWRQGSS